ncbi:MAG: hypothetical protein A2X59_10310 [Nitrospirae bacterium GWC2_42_7]|nr:MAG: hypothetical protein A2X59_10310 [Nitrospirae bacterium GWC2_42_7]
MTYFKINTRALIVSFIFALIVSFTCDVSAQALLQTGSEAEDFTLKDIDGKDVSLSQFSQKKGVAIFFWATWSANSPKALKRFESFHEKYKDKGIQIIGINADNQVMLPEDIEKVKALAKELGVTFPILIDKGLKIFHAYAIIAIPSTTVVSEGKISYELAGFPLVGTEDMFDYLSVLAGDPPRKKMAAGYQPKHDAIANTNLARGFAKRKKYEMAQPFFAKAIEKDPKYMPPYIELSKIYEIDGKDAESEETLRKGYAADSENVVIMSELGYFLSRKGKITEAIEILDKAVKKNSYTPAHYYYAYALSKNGKLKESLEAFESALSLNPYNAMTYQLRSEVYESNKMMKEASADSRKALELILKIHD